MVRLSRKELVMFTRKYGSDRRSSPLVKVFAELGEPGQDGRYHYTPIYRFSNGVLDMLRTMDDNFNRDEKDTETALKAFKDFYVSSEVFRAKIFDENHDQVAEFVRHSEVTPSDLEGVYRPMKRSADFNQRLQFDLCPREPDESAGDWTERVASYLAEHGWKRVKLS